MKLSSIGYLTKEGLKNIWTNRMMSLASVVVLVSCLIITGTAALLSLNVTVLIDSIGDDNQLTIYLKPEFSDIDSVKLGMELSKIKNIESYHFNSRSDVLKEYKDTLGEGIYEAMEGKGNPFGNEYKVRLKDLSKYDETVKQINKLNGIDKVSDRSNIAEKLTRLNYFVSVVGIWVVLVLAVVTLFIISNTIKMTMYSRRFEIGIMKSVGATNAFVRIPFVIEAMVIGLLAGLLASGAILLMYSPIRSAASGIIGMISTSTLPVEKIWLPTLIALSGTGILIGLLGGFISIARYINKEGGEIIGR